MTFLTEKALKSKKFQGATRIYILAKDVDLRRNFKSKPKNFGLKRPNFLGNLNSGSCVQSAQTLLQNIFLFKKYQDPEKISLLDITRSRNKWGGGALRVLSLDKRPGSLRVKGRVHLCQQCRIKCYPSRVQQYPRRAKDLQSPDRSNCFFKRPRKRPSPSGPFFGLNFASDSKCDKYNKIFLHFSKITIILWL